MKQTHSNDLIRILWLEYFNRVLKEKGILNEREYFRMLQRIRAGYTTPKKTEGKHSHLKTCSM